MLYTYRHNIQRGGNSHYVDIVFDKQISRQSVYRSGILREKATFVEKQLMDGIAKINGVIASNGSHSEDLIELIHLDGNAITVKVSAVDSKQVRLSYMR